MASSKKGSGTSRLEKGVNGRRSSKHKEGPLGEVFFFIFNLVYLLRSLCGLSL